MRPNDKMLNESENEAQRSRGKAVIVKHLPPPPANTMILQLHALMTLMNKRSLTTESADLPLKFSKKDGLIVVGNNGFTEVRTFDANTKIGPQTSHFIDRGRSIFDAALSLLGLPKGKLPPELMSLWDNFARQIKDTCHIDPDKMRGVLEDQKALQDYFKPIYGRALYLLNQLCTGLINIIKTQYPKFNSKDLRKKETEIFKSQGRSNLVNFIDLDIAQRPTQLISCLSTITSVTTPSNITNEGNRNLVREDRFVKIDDQLIKMGSAMRLGAISSFGEENEIKRKCLNAANAKELLQVSAVEKITESNLNVENYLSEDHPLQIDIFSSTLLSPYAEHLGKILDMFDLIPDELQMVLEHHEALMLYHDRTLTLHIELNNGVKRTIYVKPNIIHFNVPANINRELQHNLISEDQDNINAEGGFKYLEEANKLLKTRWLLDNDIKNVLPENLRTQIGQCREMLKKTLIWFDDYINQDELNKELQSTKQQLVSLKAKLTYENEQVVKVIQKLKENPTDDNNIHSYKEHIQNINSLNQAIFQIYKKHYQACNKFRKQKVEYGDISTDMAGFLQINYERIDNLLKTHAEYFSMPENFKLKQQLLLGLAYINVQRMLFDEDPAINYKFKENALLMIALMHTIMQAGDFINSYGCKSAKDRTGLLTIYKDAIVIFAEQYGSYPDPTQENDSVIFKNIIMQLIYLSPSALNSTQNDPGAYGLQIQDPFIIAHLMGLIAKGAFSDVASKKSILQTDLTQTDPAWQQQILPIIKIIHNINLRFIESGQSDKSLANDLLMQRSQLNQLCENMPELKAAILRWEENYSRKDSAALHNDIEQKQQELLEICRKLEEIHDAQTRNDSEFIKNFISDIRKLSLRSTSKDEAKYNEKFNLLIRELDYIHSLLAIKHMNTESKKYIEILKNYHKTTHKLSDLVRLERFEIADHKQLLNNVQLQIEKLALRDNIQHNTIYKEMHKNLKRFRIGLLLQEAKYSGMLPKAPEHIANRDNKNYISEQINLVKIAIEHLDNSLKEKENETILREAQKLPVSISLQSSIKDIKSYRENLQGYMDALSIAMQLLEVPEEIKQIKPDAMTETINKRQGQVFSIKQ